MSTSGAISFQFHQTSFRLRHRNAIRLWLEHCVSNEGIHLQELNFMFSTDTYVRNMNKEHLTHDYCTDILTFPYPSGQGICGDILISIDRVRDNAKHHGTSTLNETHRVMAHGVLHLLGQDDTSPELQAEMRAKENSWLLKRTFI